MDIEEFLKNPEKVSHHLDYTNTLIKILEYNILNKVQLGAVIQNQVEIMELLKGSTGTELDDKVKDRLEHVYKCIDDAKNKEYYTILRDVLK